MVIHCFLFILFFAHVIIMIKIEENFTFSTNLGVTKRLWKSDCGL